MRYLVFLVALTAAASGVGSISFPVTASPQTQACFERGVGMLHNFWFEEAREQFQSCTKADPRFAMGYWGEAMTWNYPLWNQVWPEDGKKALAKAPVGAKITSREQAYLDAVKRLYGEGKKKEREAAYSTAMEKIYKEQPSDLEAAAFYSLSLIALGSERQRMKAGAIALDIYDKNRDHPGAAHYIIHAFDDPVHAILALPAAKRYAEIAPESHHARHMPSHIFLQLGMWNETVKSNEDSWAASVAWQKRKGHPLDRRDYHSQYWLAYGYLQQGRYADAWKIYEDKKKDIIEAQGSGRVYGYWPDLAAALIIETGEWDRAKTAFDDPVVIRRSSGKEHAHSPDSEGRALAALTQGLAAARAGQDIKPYTDRLEQVRQIMEQRDSKIPAARAQAQALMVEAASAAQRKDYGTAITKLKEATKLEEMDSAPSGPPEIIKPTHELFGEILLAAGKPKEAAEQFSRALERQPNRTRSVKGLAQAKQMMTSESGQ